MNAHLLILSSLVLATSAAVIPNTWKTCKRNDPLRNECLKTAISIAIKDLKSGKSEYGVPSLEPLRIDSLGIHSGSMTINLKLHFKNLYMHGLSTAVFDRVKADWDNNRIIMEFHTTVPLKIESDYTSNGRILVIPIRGAGRSTLVLDNFKGKISFQMRRTQRNGKEYLEVVKTDIGIDTSRLHLNFKRTVNAAEGLSQNLNSFLNSNWKELLQELRPAISQAFSKKFSDVANSVFFNVPLDELAPL